jgi:hypothetical protein
MWGLWKWLLTSSLDSERQNIATNKKLREPFPFEETELLGIQ